MNRRDLILATALRMDEVSASDSPVVVTAVDSSDNNPLYTLIDGLLDECLVEVYNAAPWWRLNQKPFPSIPASATFDPVTGRYHIAVPVPADYLKLAEINCLQFQRPINEVHPEGSEEGSRQHNRHLVAKLARPVAIMSHNATGREIDCYSLASPEVNALVATYIARPVLPKDAAPEINADVLPDALVAPLEWLTAGKAFSARGNVNGAQTCMKNAQNLLI